MFAISDGQSVIHCGQSRVRDTKPVSNSTLLVSKKSFCVLWHNLCFYLCSAKFSCATKLYKCYSFFRHFDCKTLKIFSRLRATTFLFSLILTKSACLSQGYQDLESLGYFLIRFSKLLLISYHFHIK